MSTIRGLKKTAATSPASRRRCDERSPRWPGRPEPNARGERSTTLEQLAWCVALALSMVAAPAGAQVASLIFADGFESGTRCAWSKAPTGIASILPEESSVGTEIVIEGCGFGAGRPEVFLSRETPEEAQVPLEVLAFGPGRIVARLDGPAAPGTYDLTVARSGEPAVLVARGSFAVRAPSDLDLDPVFVERETVVTMTARFLGSQPGTVALISQSEPRAGKLKTEVLSWEDRVHGSSDDGDSDSDSAHGGGGGQRGRVVFAVPPVLPSNGYYDLEVTNAVGSVIELAALVAVGVPADDGEGPRLVNAGAVSNTEVLVQFSEALQGGPEGAENPAHYRISAPDARIPVLGVLEAELVLPDLSTVRLKTLSQSDLHYTLKVTDLRDLAGNPIPPPERFVDPSTTTFVGMGASGDDHVDTDGDGLSDAEEQRGWLVNVHRADGGIEPRHVTSEPGDPRLPADDPVNVAAQDTDGDGVTDLEEKHGGMDPRAADTDGDTLTDNEEWNVIYSNPTHQDTDGDGTQDGFELYSYRSSPILADTDGDQLTDTEEVLERNRDPRIADLPRAAIHVGEVRLQIDERFTFQDAVGSTVTVESSSSSTLSQSENTTFATSDTDVTQHVASARIEGGSESGAGGRGNFFLDIEGSYQYTTSSTFQTSRQSALESQRVHEQSLRKAEELTSSSTVTREVFGAAIDVDLTIENAGDVAFAIRNLEVTVLQRSRESRDRFLPVATLVANSTLITGEPAVFHLGPFTPERGPILFSSRDVFPSLVEELMQSPAGLIFEVANFDMTDELGRAFTFANQTARDRTAGVIVDFGDGEVERHLVATALQPDSDGFAGGGFVGGFNADGSPLGIPLDFALQDTLELTKNATEVDGIVAGANQEAESFAAGDDVQLIPPGTTGVGVGSIVVAAGQNGVLESVPSGDDQAEVTTGYETSLTCSSESANARVACGEDADCNGGTCTGPEILVRFGSQRTGDFNREWVVLTTREIPAGADFGKVVLKPGEDIYFAFIQDLDDDGLFAREEYMAGSIDSRSDVLDNALFGEDFDENAVGSQVSDGLPDSKDTDRDGLGDFAEIRVGWKVAGDGGDLRRVLSSPRLRDSDGDGLLDPIETDLRRYCAAAGDPRTNGLCAFQLEPPVAQTDAVAIVAGPNGIADSVALAADEQLIAPGVGGLPYGTPVVGVGVVEGMQTPLSGDDVYESLSTVPPASDPTLGDTDADAVGDFAELTGFEIGLSIRDGGNGLAETQVNGDDVRKAFPGNPVKPGGIVILPGPNGTIDSAPGGDDALHPGQTVVTDPLRRDTDSDLVADGRELAQGADPTDPFDGQDFRDSDQDGLTDSEETDLGWTIRVNGSAVEMVVNSNPSLPDTDFDGLPDFVERDLRTDPNNPDTDGDGLRDHDEFADFERYSGLEEQFPRFFLDGSSSEKYGTDPTHQDSDRDSLSDRAELIEGYRLLLAGEQEFREIFTNPLADDTDFDGVDDNEERFGDPATDATDPDTDDDGRTDGQEKEADTNPLVPDIRITVQYVEMAFNGGPNDGGNNLPDWVWALRVGVGSSYPGATLSSHITFHADHPGFGEYKDDPGCERLSFGNASNLFFGTGAQRSFSLHPGEGFSMRAEVKETDSCKDGVRELSCDMLDFKFFSFEDFAGMSGGFVGDRFILNDEKCAVDVLYQIFVD